MKDKIEDVINRKPDLLLIHSTVGKQAKRMPDATVETTPLENQKYLPPPGKIPV